MCLHWNWCAKYFVKSYSLQMTKQINYKPINTIHVHSSPNCTITVFLFLSTKYWQRKHEIIIISTNADCRCCQVRWNCGNNYISTTAEIINNFIVWHTTPARTQTIYSDDNNETKFHVTSVTLNKAKCLRLRPNGQCYKDKAKILALTTLTSLHNCYTCSQHT